jgi:hypothetical protein
MIKNKEKECSVDILEEINIDGPLGLSDPAAILTNEELSNIAEVFRLVEIHQSVDYTDPAAVILLQGDVIKLQAIQVLTSSKLARLIAYVNNIQEELKVARAKARAQIKKIKERDNLRITLDEIKDLSYLATEELRIKLEDYNQSAQFCQFIYYTLRDHINYLDKTITRAYMRGEVS